MSNWVAELLMTIFALVFFIMLGFLIYALFFIPNDYGVPYVVEFFSGVLRR